MLACNACNEHAMQGDAVVALSMRCKAHIASPHAPYGHMSACRDPRRAEGRESCGSEYGARRIVPRAESPPLPPHPIPGRGAALAESLCPGLMSFWLMGRGEEDRTGGRAEPPPTPPHPQEQRRARLVVLPPVDELLGTLLVLVHLRGGRHLGQVLRETLRDQQHLAARGAEEHDRAPEEGG